MQTEGFHCILIDKLWLEMSLQIRMNCKDHFAEDGGSCVWGGFDQQFQNHWQKLLGIMMLWDQNVDRQYQIIGNIESQLENGNVISQIILYILMNPSLLLNVSVMMKIIPLEIRLHDG